MTDIGQVRPPLDKGGRADGISHHPDVDDDLVASLGPLANAGNFHQTVGFAVTWPASLHEEAVDAS